MSNGWSRKIFLCPDEPTEDDFRPDTERILDELRKSGIPDSEPVRFSLKALRSLYPLCPDAGWKFTVTLAYDGRGWEITRLEAGDTTTAHYGLCADMGSTTLVMQLVDMESGQVMAQTDEFNPQIAWGTDILTRIFYAKDYPDRLHRLQEAVVEGFQKLIRQLEADTGVDISGCAALIVSGNTTMIHFLLGLDAFCVFHTPYAVRTLEPDPVWAGELKLPIDGYVYCVPGKANYLGGDIISGVLAAQIADRPEISVFLDIGTNGELVVGNQDFLLAGAGAAGPALEGGVVKTGMRAEPGAVDRVSIKKGSFQVHTIGNRPPKGICGSGIVELLAEMYLHGWMDFRGKLVPEASCQIKNAEGRELAAEYAPGLFFFQSDIDEFLKTKAAACTMVEYMLQVIGLSMEDISYFYVAGAFGTHIDKEAGVTIGLYPDIDRDRIISPGNTSLFGARMMLLNRNLKEKAKELIETMDYVQFGAVDDFLHLMVAATAVPHTDFSRYPSVMRRQKEIQSKNKESHL